MKGVIVCAGQSSRLFPATQRISKQLLPLYDKPLIYYPISMLMKVGIKDIIIVVNKANEMLFKEQLGSGEELGVRFTILVDEKPKGTAGSFLVAEEYIKNNKVLFILGDNFFYGKEFDAQLENAVKLQKGACVFSYPVKNPTAFGVANIDKNGKITKLVEKPKKPESNLAVTGIYVYDERAVDFAKQLNPSNRGELEVTDLNKKYLETDELNLIQLSKKNYWLDAGTADGMLKASEKICKTQKKTGKYIACLEEIALEKGFINKKQFEVCYNKVSKSDYGAYLKKYL